MIVYKTKAGTAFKIFNYVFMILFCMLVIFPFINVIAISLSSSDAIIAGKVKFVPVQMTWDAYEFVFSNEAIIRSFFVTICLTVVSTVLTMLITLLTGFALANKYTPYKKFFMTYFLITMYFSGGLIPFYLTVNNLGLYDKYPALILPFVTKVFYIIIFRNSIMQTPQELTDAAEIDGAGTARTLFSIIAPVILPMIAAFTIFSAVENWNQWYGVLLFIRDKSKWTLQYKVREILTNLDILQDFISGISATGADTNVHSDNIKMASLLMSILPIIAIYPFLQKYFMHGIIVGAVKA